MNLLLAGYYMKTKLQHDEKFEIISSSENCYKCRYRCEIAVKEYNELNIYCRHPKGPGNINNCIYFKTDQ